MRSCDEMDILIQLKLDDLLDPSQERLLEEHLRECRSCRERYEQLRVLKDALGSMEEPAPAGLHGSIMRYVEKNGAGETPAAPAAPKSKRRTLRRFLTAAAAVAACCAIVLVGKQMFPRMGSANETVFFAANDTSGANAQIAPAGGAADEAADEGAFDAAMKNQGPDTALDGLEESKQTDTSDADDRIAIDLPPMDESESWSFGVETEQQSILSARRISVTGSRASLPQDLPAGELRDATAESGGMDYILIESWAADHWQELLESAGFSWEDTGENPDGEDTVLLFTWTDH